MEVVVASIGLQTQSGLGRVPGADLAVKRDTWAGNFTGCRFQTDTLPNFRGVDQFTLEFSSTAIRDIARHTESKAQNEH
jgi:hypothetical protein